MKLLRDFSSNAVCTGLAFALGFANQALLFRELGPASRGRLGIITTAVMIGSMVLGEWLSRGNTYITGKHGRAADAMASSFVYTACLAVLLAILALAAGAMQPFDQLSGTDYLFIALLLAAIVAQRAVQAVLLGQDQQLRYAVIPLILVALYLSGNAVALLLYRSGLGGVLVAWSTAACLAALAAALMVGRGITLGRPSSALLRSTARVGSRGALSATIIYLLFRSDVFLVGHFLGEEQVGVYFACVVIAEMIQRIPNLAGVVLLPKVQAGADDDHAITLIVARRVLAGFVPIAIVVVVAGRGLIDLLGGPDYAGAFTPLLLMLPGLMATGFGSVLNTKLAGEGYPPLTIWAAAAALSSNVLLNLVLIPKWGLEGAAISTSGAYILWAVIVTIGFRRRTGVAWRQFIVE